MQEVMGLIVKLDGNRIQVDEQLIGNQNLIAALDALKDGGLVTETEDEYNFTDLGFKSARDNGIIDEFGEYINDGNTSDNDIDLEMDEL